MQFFFISQTLCPDLLNLFGSWNLLDIFLELTMFSTKAFTSLFAITPFVVVVLCFPCQLLKSELRRLERNQEREKSVANLEYLKNVLLQFIFLRSGSERQALLPVIHTMLQLSPEEKSKLAAIAQGTYWLKAI